MVIFPPPGLPVISGIPWVKPQRRDIGNPDRINPAPDQLIENVVVFFENSEDLPFGSTTHPCQGIVMPVLAFLTTVFLVASAIIYALAAFQTTRQMPFTLIVIIHIESPY